MAQPIETKRRNPLQSRAQNTVEAILDAAAQILRTQGEAQFTTNHVAERAGVSIGTLYQYFKDKDAILQKLSEREVWRLKTEIQDVAANHETQSYETMARTLVRALIDFFARRRRSKRIVIINLMLAVSSHKPEDKIKKVLDEVMETLNQAGLNELTTDETTVFVITHSLLGVLRAAMILRPELLEGPDLEERLVHIVLSFVNKVTDQKPMPLNDDVTGSPTQI